MPPQVGQGSVYIVSRERDIYIERDIYKYIEHTYVEIIVRIKIYVRFFDDL